MLETVSIVVPIYNCGNYIEKCLMSLINQTYEKIEIILVNDGSSDNSLEIIEHFMEIDSRIKVINQSNQGVSKARNTGLDNAIGKFIMFVDGDDYLDVDAVSLLVKNYKSNTLLRINYKEVREKSVKTNRLVKSKYDKNEYINEIFNDNVGGFCWGYLFLKDRISYFDENTSYMEDTIFLFNYLMGIDMVEIVDNVYYYYLFNENSITKTNKRVIKNIVDFNYSLDKIYMILDNIEMKDKINKKKLRLIEYELSKVRKEDIVSILDDDVLGRIFQDLYREGNFFGFNKFYLYILLSKKYFLFYCYLCLRRLVRKIKNVKGKCN